LQNIKKIERLANENTNIAKKEKDTATEMKNLAKRAIKRAKAREMLVRNEIELAKIRERLAEKSKKLTETKEQVKDILKLSEGNLIFEKNQAIYNEMVAQIQIEIAENQRRIAEQETEIAEVKIKLANKKFNAAKERGKLGKKQFIYVKLVKANSPEGKISKAEEAYLSQQKHLTKVEVDALEISKEIVKRQNNLANLKKILSEKLAEREKIRP